MQLGAVLAAGGTGAPTRDVLVACIRAGFNLLQINLAPHQTLNICELTQLCADAEIKLSALGCYANPLQPARQSAGISADEIEEVLEHLPQTQQDPWRIVTWSGTLSGTPFTPHPGNQSPGALAEIAAWAERLTPMLQRKNALLLFCPHHAHVLHDWRTTKEFLARLDTHSIGIALDPCNFLSPKNFHERETMIAQALESLGPHILLAYLRDARIANFNITLCAPGQGQMGYTGLVRQLAQHCSNVPWLVDGVESELQLKRAREYVNLHARMGVRSVH